MKNDLKREIVLEDKVTAELKGSLLRIKGPKGEVERDFPYPQVDLKVQDGKIIISSPKASKRIKMQFGSIVSHIKNTLKGVKELHIYKLKVCSGHFPMNVAVSGNEITIKNFFGETVARKAKLPKGIEIKVSGNDITISSPDIEAAGLAASTIENLCRITNRDIRIFQDGCYITQKPE
ncbi:MAG: 50S ribosomal protein L6 [Candidatus Woesearchaeota archaeon]|jgi:large subunit ribosomal protein L6